MATKLPLIVIVGPTASGKTGLAVELAEQYGGEIICADSRTVYRGMDLGTAKPSYDEQLRVPHWGINLVEPDVRYSVGQFQQYAKQKIVDIRKRGKIPLLVGGTGLYVDSVIFDYNFPQPPSPEMRKALELLSKEELYKYCIENNVELPENDKNKRHIIQHALKKDTVTTRNDTIDEMTYVVGIATNKRTLRSRISLRTEHMFEHGVVDESIMLGKKYGWGSEAMRANVYRAVKPYLENAANIEEAKEKNTTLDMQLVKRQMTWFRRNPFIEWCQLEEAKAYVASVLARRQ